MRIDKKFPSAQSLLLQSAHADLFGMRSYQKMVSDVPVFSPGRNSEELLVESVKKLRIFEKNGLADPPGRAKTE